MKAGTLIVTTGLPRISGVTALLSLVGTISADADDLRIPVCRCFPDRPGGGPGRQKSERLLVQNGVIFLWCENGETDFFHGLKHGLFYMQNKIDRLFVVPGDTPLFLPSTVHAASD